MFQNEHFSTAYCFVHMSIDFNVVAGMAGRAIEGLKDQVGRAGFENWYRE